MRLRAIQKRILSVIMAFLTVCLFLVPDVALARDSLISQYIQTVYNQKNGIGSSEVNCLLQSSSGYIWVGTDGGLYRSDGAEFQSINLWDTDRTDVYSINCLYQDTEGRVWIGTDNYGLFYIQNSETYHFQDEYYSGIKKIKDICETADGTIYAASESGIYICLPDSSGQMRMQLHTDSSLSGIEVSKMAAKDDNVWLVTQDNLIYIINSEKALYTVDAADIISDDIISIEEIDGYMYVGGTGREIIKFRSRSSYETISVSVDGVNGMMTDLDGRIWVCAENGIGYIDGSDTFVRVNDCEIDTYLTDIIQDYEGNYWIASSRMGLLLLSRSKFTDYNMSTGMQETMVNSVYTYGDMTYIGSDEGLIIYDKNGDRVSNELTDMLSGVSVRNISSDSDGNIWISTYRKYGLVKVAADGTTESFGRSDNLPSQSVTCSIELSGGMIAVGTDEGVAVMTKSGTVKYTYTEEDGISYPHINCLYQDSGKKIYAGTDDGGIYVITLGNDTDIENYTVESDLNSNVVTSIAEGSQGLWIGTDSGLCFYNESFRSISNIEVSNSIYDVLYDGSELWIIGSMGVLHSSEEELLGNEGLSERYLNENDGLTKTINMTGQAYIDDNQILYVCCDTGICTIDTGNIYINETAPKIRVTAVEIDDQTYEFNDFTDGLKVDNNTSRITIDFAVFSYCNRSNIQVEYSLNGFDENPIVISGTDTMEAVYTNLDGGTYEFTISANNGDGTMCESEISFTIVKEKRFFENRLARILLVTVILLVLLAAVFLLLHFRKTIRKNSTALERLSKEHEEAIKSSSAKNDYLANMSNEIKTPINAMMVKADELVHIFENDEENKAKILSIYEIGGEIINKVDDIILLAKIEAGRVATENAPYSITGMIYELAEKYKERIGDRSVKFFVELGDILSDNVVGDAGKIADIIDRLLDNAVKYTKEGSITLSVDCFEYANKSHHGMMNVVFTVSDTGIGIQEDRLDGIFESYSIVDNAKSGIHAGNGVGLAIAKGYADLIRGEIEAESVYGSGSTFSLSLIQKIAGADTDSRSISKIEDKVSQEKADKLWLPEVTALIVDDDDVSREVSARVLERFEMKVDVASSGVSAIDMVMNHDYDVIFMDLTMPIMSGIDAMREIRDIDGDSYAYLPIIAMDTNAIEEDRETLLGEGFTDSLLKPLEPRRIAAILMDCLPGEMIKEKSSDMEQYISGSRYGEGLYKLKAYLDVEGAIDKIGGSIDVYNRLIVTYYNQNMSAADELHEKMGKDARGFKNKIHSIRTNSAGIGASSLSKEASRLEAAINIGNRDYVKDNIEIFTDDLLDILLAVEEYISYMDGVSGMSDEEYAKKKARERELKDKEKEDGGEIYDGAIDINLLRVLKNDSDSGDYDSAKKTMALIMSTEYTGEDAEFTEVLKEAIDNKDAVMIAELITTYYDLKFDKSQDDLK